MPVPAVKTPGASTGLLTVPDAVNALAATFKRPPGSITNKMLNLDGSRPNAARPEPELFIRLQQPGRFDPVYRRVIKTARLEGFSEALVPDFLVTIDDQGEMFAEASAGSVLRVHSDRNINTGRTPGQSGAASVRRRCPGEFDWQCGFRAFAPGTGLAAIAC
jgi:hypothetical protein